MGTGLVVVKRSTQKVPDGWMAGVMSCETITGGLEQINTLCVANFLLVYHSQVLGPATDQSVANSQFPSGHITAKCLAKCLDQPQIKV